MYTSLPKLEKPLSKPDRNYSNDKSLCNPVNAGTFGYNVLIDCSTVLLDWTCTEYC